MRKPPASPEQLARARELRGSGLSYAAVAKELGVPASVAYRWANRDPDARAEQSRANLAKSDAAAASQRAAAETRRRTSERVEDAEWIITTGDTFALNVARRLGMEWEAVRTMLYREGRHDLLALVVGDPHDSTEEAA